MFEIPLKLSIDLSKVRRLDRLFISIPLLILNFFGSGYLLLWAINDFSFDIISSIGTILLALPLSSIIFLFFVIPALMVLQGVQYKRKKAKNSTLTVFFMNFIAGWYFAFDFVFSLFLKYLFYSDFFFNFLVIYIIFLIVTPIIYKKQKYF